MHETLGEDRRGLLDRSLPGDFSWQVDSDLALPVDCDHLMGRPVYGLDLDPSTCREQVSAPRTGIAERPPIV